jgi:hypothetical protein
MGEWPGTRRMAVFGPELAGSESPSPAHDRSVRDGQPS